MTTAFGHCRRIVTAATCAVAAVALGVVLWPASALADTTPSITVDPKLITVAIVVVSVVVVAAIAWFVIRRIRRQRVASSPGSASGVVVDGNTDERGDAAGVGAGGPESGNADGRGDSGTAGGADPGGAAESGSAGGGADPGGAADGDGGGTD